MSAESEKSNLRELFIEDLAEVQGGTTTTPEDLFEKVREKLLTTHGCCEELPVGCC